MRMDPVPMKNRKPKLAPPKSRSAGVCLHLSSLPGTYGIGGIGTDARAFVRALQAMQATVWQFLPIGPTAFGNSPYQPLSVFAGNELLIDVDSLIADGLLRHRDVMPLTGFARDTVDFDHLIPVKTAILAGAAANFEAHGAGALRTGLEEFMHLADAEWLHDYARFRVLKLRNGQVAWPHWERRYRRRYQRSLAKFDRDERAEIKRVKILQFLFDRQWRELQSFAACHDVWLFGDMPIYVASDSADAWVRPDLLQMNRDGVMQAHAGVPPDYFDVDGQRWGNPLYRWRRHRDEDFKWWVQRLRRAITQADLVRIDHFRGFESFWSIPADAETARAGRWVKGPGDALFRAFENALGQLPIVAEDLGEITPAVIALRRRFDIPGMQVLQFAFQDENFAPGQIDEDCVCYTGTHDNDTTRGWFSGDAYGRRSAAGSRMLQARVLELTGGSEATVHIDLFRMALDSKARMAVAPMQDLLGLGSESRMNTPGTTAGNWRWRMQEGELSARLIDQVGTFISRSGRSAVLRGATD